MSFAPKLVKEHFPLSTHAYHSTHLCMRSTYKFKLENVKTAHYDTESLSFLGLKNWELVPLEIKSSHSLEEFKKKIKSWIPEYCPSKLCKTYLHCIGFILKYFLSISFSTIVYDFITNTLYYYGNDKDDNVSF